MIIAKRSKDSEEKQNQFMFTLANASHMREIPLRTSIWYFLLVPGEVGWVEQHARNIKGEGSDTWNKKLVTQCS